MSYIGNSPGVASQRVETAFTATSNQTAFTPTSGYTLGYCDVYQNGVKLVNGDDYTASDGVTVTLATGAASGDSIVIVASFPRGLSDGYLKSEADAKYVALTGAQTVAGVKTFSSQIVGIAGTAGAPAVTTTGDTDTGIFFPAANTIAFSTNGSEDARFDSAGNFGIGTTSPSAKLHVNNGFLQVDISGSQAIRVGSSDSLIGGTNNNAVIQAASSKATLFLTGGTENMRLDASGNLGLRVTPSGWSSATPTFQIGAFGVVTAHTSANYCNIGTNYYFNGSNNVYIGTGAATLYSQNAGAHAWYVAGSGTANNTVSFSQALTLDASGNLGVANTGPSFRIDATTAGSVISGTATIGSNMAGMRIYNSVTATTNNAVGLWLATGPHQAGIAALRPNAEGGWETNLVFYTHPTSTSNLNDCYEAMRITGAGNLLVGKGATDWTANGLQTELSGRLLGVTTNDAANNLFLRKNNATGTVIQFWYNSNDVGKVSISTTNTTYSTSSDYRLKEDIQPMTGALARVAALKPVTYKWKADGSEGEGFIAHELQEVVPDAVVGEKDGTRIEQYEISPAVPATVDEDGNEMTPAIEAVMGEREVPVYQGIDTSFLVATLTAAIQEQQAIIEQLQADVATLKGTP